jgi:hypothetical protein
MAAGKTKYQIMNNVNNSIASGIRDKLSNPAGAVLVNLVFRKVRSDVRTKTNSGTSSWAYRQVRDRLYEQVNKT